MIEMASMNRKDEKISECEPEVKGQIFLQPKHIFYHIFQYFYISSFSSSAVFFPRTNPAALFTLLVIKGQFTRTYFKMEIDVYLLSTSTIYNISPLRVCVTIAIKVKDIRLQQCTT